MAKWVTEEVGKENLPADPIAGIAGRSALEATVASRGSRRPMTWPPIVLEGLEALATTTRHSSFRR